jgi:osmoprotectant transport system ATP-binding protein
VFRLERVTKLYRTVAAVDDVSVEFAARTVNAIIGTSGSGKSTVLRLLLGLEWPERGRILVDGHPLVRAERLLLRRRVGYVIQDGGLFPHLTARDNLALLPRYLGWHASAIDARATELAALMQLSAGLLGHYPGELSGGQRQRVAVMRALMTDPPALLLDEPLGALDPLVRFELQDQLRQLFTTLGKTVIIVTHDLPEAAFLAPRLLLMRNGRIVQDGNLEDLLEHPADEFVRRFVVAQRTLPTARAQSL